MADFRHLLHPSSILVIEAVRLNQTQSSPARKDSVGSQLPLGFLSLPLEAGMKVVLASFLLLG